MAKNKNKTEVERVIELLEKEGFKEFTEEEKQTDWYKEEMESIENISCKFETEEEFERLCKK